MDSLFGKAYDAEFYKKVTHVCALSRDFEVLTDGDLTQIGEKGINLSGTLPWLPTPQIE